MKNEFKQNWYALFLSIVKNRTSSESLEAMGLSEGINKLAIQNRRQTV